MHIPALNLGYLTAQTQGDIDLERQLLTLFRAQARQIVTELQSATDISPNVNANFAHLLKGSALAIGATRIAATAAAYERLIVSPDHNGSEKTLLEALADAVDATVAAIDQHIGSFDRGILVNKETLRGF